MEKEKEVLLRNIDEIKATEADEKVKKAERVKKLLAEVEASNKEAIKLKV